jgi:hypothetical protein
LLRFDGVAVVNQVLDGVSDFQFAAPRRLNRARGFEDVLVEQVDADQREVAWRAAWVSR